MTPHRFTPIPLALDELDRKPRWRCACGLERQDPTPRLTDDCSAIPLFSDSERKE